MARNSGDKSHKKAVHDARCPQYPAQHDSHKSVDKPSKRESVLFRRRWTECGIGPEAGRARASRKKDERLIECRHYKRRDNLAHASLSVYILLVISIASQLPPTPFQNHTTGFSFKSALTTHENNIFQISGTLLEIYNAREKLRSRSILDIFSEKILKHENMWRICIYIDI